jgi:hypothetical protein
MTEGELGRELLGAAGPGADGRVAPAPEEFRRLVARSRRRAHIMAGVTIAMWSAVAVGFFYMVYGYFVFFHPMIIHAIEEGGADERLGQAMRVLPTAAVYVTAIWGAAIVAAAVSTVVFIFASRHATLRQIQASLREIAACVKR